MKKLFYLFLIAAAFVGCTQNEPEKQEVEYVDFEVYIMNNNSVEFTNKSSSGMIAARWDFGDGEFVDGRKQYDDGTRATFPIPKTTHEYKEKGIYNVKLTCLKEVEITKFKEVTRIKQIDITKGY